MANNCQHKCHKIYTIYIGNHLLELEIMNFLLIRLPFFFLSSIYTDLLVQVMNY
jgi:hypothetical protein